MMTITSGTTVKTLKFYYDAEGVPFYFDYNGTKYFYITNLQGDVVGIANSNGIVGYYEYDAWGRILSINSASSNEYGALTYNPLRYRGYIYDTETGFYYLQTRYYDPAIRRFISADDVGVLSSTPMELTDKNLFAYCDNNPVMRKDDGGEFWNYVVGGIVGAVIGAVTTAVDAVKKDGWGALTSGKTWAKIGISAACGTVNGLVAASGAFVLTGGAVGSTTGFVESFGHKLIDTDGELSQEDWLEIGKDTIVGFVGGLAGGNGATHGNKYMMRQESRFLKHLIPDGISKAHSFAWKMTANYSKQFIVPTLKGLTKGWFGGKLVDKILP